MQLSLVHEGEKSTENKENIAFSIAFSALLWYNY